MKEGYPKTSDAPLGGVQVWLQCPTCMSPENLVFIENNLDEGYKRYACRGCSPAAGEETYVRFKITFEADQRKRNRLVVEGTAE